jgi:hypothetical protein
VTTKGRIVALVFGSLVVEVFLLMIAFAPVSSVSREQEESVLAYGKNPTSENKQKMEKIFSEKNAGGYFWQYVAFAGALVVPIAATVAVVRMRRS